MPSGNDIDELLSGYLDGQLSDEELGLIETAMQQDPSLVLRVEELREISQSLRQLSRQPASRLSADFTSKVLSRCREATLATQRPTVVKGLSAAFESLPSSPTESNAKPLSTNLKPDSSRRASRRKLRIASAIAAIAGTVLLVAWLPQVLRQEHPITPLAEKIDSAETPQEGSSDRSELLAALDETESKSGSQLTPAFPLEGTEILTPGELDSSHLADGGAARSVEELDRASNRDSVEQETERLASQRPGGSEINYILVLDLEITELAAKQNVLGTLFAKYGIDLAAGVAMNSQIEKAVSRMRFSVPENQPLKGAELFLLRASATILDAAVRDLEAEVELVPGYRFDLAFQTPTVSLSQAIIDSLGEQQAGNSSLAIPVVADTETSQIARVESIPYQGTLISTNRRRERFDSAADESAAGSDLSYLLILVRQR